jgi:hypothetical protein
MPKSKKGKAKKNMKKGTNPNPIPNNGPTNKKKNKQKNGKSNGPKSFTVGHARRVCSITNPFCPEAKGSKWPDGTLGSTLTEQVRANYTLACDGTNKNALMMISPALLFGYMVCASTSSTVCTTPAFWTALSTSTLYGTYGNEFRVVSAGVIIRNTGSSVNSQGIITLGVAPVPGLSTAYTLGSENYSETLIRAIAPGLELSHVFAPLGAGARNFVPATNNNGPGATYDWSSLWIELSGGAGATTTVNVEYFVNIEFTVGGHAALAKLAQSNPPSVPIAVQASSTISSKIGTFIEGGVSEVEDMFMKAASSALNNMSNPFTDLLALF